MFGWFPFLTSSPTPIQFQQKMPRMEEKPAKTVCTGWGQCRTTPVFLGLKFASVTKTVPLSRESQTRLVFSEFTSEALVPLFGGKRKPSRGVIGKGNDGQAID